MDDDAHHLLIPAITRMFAERLHLEVPSADDDLIDQGLLDSLLLVELLVEIERQFQLTVSVAELDLDDFRSVRRIAAYIHRRRGLVDADAH